MPRITGPDLKKYSAFANQLAKGAGAVLKNGFSRSMKVTMKGRIDPVTEFDLKSEKLIVSSIKKKFPDHDLLTEEGKGGKDRTSLFRWVIDPLDGTVNFSHGFPIYCVSIGLEFDGDIIAGAVYDPERDELFSAIIGQGSKLNGKRISVSKEKRLERALVATGFAYDIGHSKKNNLGYFARVAKKVQGVRRPGSAAIDLCWLAAGRVDAFWELKLHPWDTAASSLIVHEAGGRLSRVHGEKYNIYDLDLLATNGHLHNGMLSLLSAR